MSMNLKCNDFDLIQTPTFLTYLVMTNNKGKILLSVKGNKCKGVIQRLLYCYYFLRQEEYNRNADSPEAQKAIDNIYRGIIHDLKDKLKLINKKTKIQIV